MSRGDEPATPAPAIRLGILGPMSANVDGSDVGLGGVKQRAVLAMLILAKGQPVTSDRLIDAMWPDQQPRNAPAALQAYVSHLRRALAPGSAARSRSAVIVSQAQGYALQLGDHDVDAWAFERAMSQLADVTDPATRASTLRAALSQWRGAALLDFADEEWARAEAQRLTELRSVGQEQLIEARLALGESGLVVPDIQTLLDTEPLREERWRLLALALYRSHRQADALAALRRARTMLDEELGLQPSPALQALEQQILEHATTLDVTPTAVVPHPRVAESIEEPSDGANSLVDRESELRRLVRCLDDALAASAGPALIEGAAGIGKSALLAEIRRQATRRGMRVLSARGSLLEKEYGFGALRQIFDPVLARSELRETVLAGAAATAATVFDATAGAASAAPEGMFGVLHGAYWMTVNLSSEQPLAICIDDIQWVDAGSLRFLAYLVRRLEGIPVAVFATLRTGESYGPDEELIAELTAEPSTVMIAPEPLSLSGVAELVRAGLGEDADAIFVTACHRTTGGNPLLLRQLLRALEADQVRPIAAHADTVRAIGSRAISSLVLRRFLRLPEASRSVARAVAVLGDGASLPSVSALAGHDEAATAAAISALARAEVLRGDFPIGFVHPLVEAAVYGDIPSGERELQHERAAAVLASAGAPPERIAAQLMFSTRRGSQQAVQTLRDAARREVERGAADSAISYLVRALQEPPDAADLPFVQLELGRVETMANGPAAVEHLSAAYAALDDPALRAQAAVELTRTLVFASTPGRATAFARSAVEDLDEAMVDERQHLVALERVAGFMHDLDPAVYDAAHTPEIVGTGIGARALAATLAWECLIAGQDRDRAIELASFAIEGGALQQVDTGLLWVVAGNVLGLSGLDTDDFWAAALSDAYSRGGLFAALGIHLWHGFCQWKTGDLREAQQSFLNCTEQNELWGAARVGQPYVDAFMIRVLLDRGDLAAARAHLDAIATRDPIGEGARLVAESEALVRFAEGRLDAALASIEAAESLMTVIHNPVWRSAAQLKAPILAALGRTDEAIEITERELAAARTWGTPALIGTTLRILGQLTSDSAALREAVEHLQTTSARLQFAQALAALADQLSRERSHTDSEVVRLRRRALHLAHVCGADGLATEVSSLLALAGIRVGYASTVETTLTTNELRIARLAADGAVDREIAQSLFITPRTVQLTVASVCSKLGIDSLGALKEALARA